ncbi:aminoglycoside phosphotransferase family protein [Paenibacillus sp. IITD108]|uniref:aminoglycoside phosphotransferase family protein n=1 Tax=Paenibacillus sp. IITD108 TaxID=3116649 RepID=UPI002F42BE76
MSELVGTISWQEKSNDFPASLNTEVSMSPLAAGLEADVFQLDTKDAQYVLKVWNRISKPDLSIQYKFLDSLFNLGAAVSRPYGWGIDKNNNGVLLTSYDGMPIRKVSSSKLNNFAKMLVDIHKLELEKTDFSTIPKCDFITYFYPRIDEHLDIKEVLVPLVEMSNMKNSSPIHGDYNLGNIVEYNNKFTIIDWTNIQLGDPRYDIAWSIILMWIYVSERNSNLYRSAFISAGNYSAEELEVFEAIACLRWILLNRLFSLPKRTNTKATIKSIIGKNKFLQDGLF